MSGRPRALLAALLAALLLSACGGGGGGETDLAPPEEIGRASCRERV